jgi:hypothetical protein
MLPSRISFSAMKKDARLKIRLLEKANPERKVLRAIKALKRVVDILDNKNDCTGMGFRLTFSKPTLESPRRRAPGKRAGRS